MVLRCALRARSSAKNTSASVFIVWELKELTEYCQLLKKGSGSAQMYHEILPPCTHAQKEINCSNASLHPSEQFYMHKNTSASVFIVWELKELTEYCQLLKKGSGRAQMYHEILPPCTHAQKEITCSNASLHPSEQFYMHKNTSGSVLIVWELIELTEQCHLLKKRSESALEVRRCTTKFSYLAHMRRKRSPVQMQVYIPVNSSICIRTLREVYSSCES